MGIDIRLLGDNDAAVLDNVADEVFDHDLDPEMTRRFLQSATHHIAVAIDDGRVVGMATANEYLHPDKPAQIWINEVGVAASHRRQGVGKLLLRQILDYAGDNGFGEIWLGTEVDNAAARALYRSMGGREESFVMYSWEIDRDDRRE